jgi:hypothetical protein
MQSNVIKIYNNAPDVRWVITFRYVGTPYCYPFVLSPQRIIVNYRHVCCFGSKKIIFRCIESVFIPAFTFDHPPLSGAEVKERVELYLYKSRAVPLLHLWAFVACYRVNFTFALLSTV